MIIWSMLSKYEVGKERKLTHSLASTSIFKVICFPISLWRSIMSFKEYKVLLSFGIYYDR